MAFSPLRGGGYVLLVLTGWAAGRWIWPGNPIPAADGPGAGAGSARLPAEPGHKPLENADAAKPVDGKAAGLVLRATGSDAAFRDRARRMALESPPALTDFLATVTDSETVRQALLEDAVVWAFSRKPEAGLALLSSLPDSPVTAALAGKALQFFPPKDLPVVLAWFHRLPAGELRTETLSVMLPALARNDYQKALDLVVGLPRDNPHQKARREELLNQFIFGDSYDYIKSRDHPATVLFPEEDREFLEKTVEMKRFQQLRQYNPEAALLKLSGPEGGDVRVSLEGFFTGWAVSDPIRAARELEQLPVEAVRPQIYHQFAAKWADGNAGTASQWVKQLPEGELKQGAIGGLVMSLANDYPVEAVLWAGALTDSAGRIADLHHVLSIARGKVVPGLEEAVNSLNLTPDERKQLTLPTAP